MKIFRNISIIAFLLVFSSACTHDGLDSDIIEIPKDNGLGYINFDTALATKGSLLTTQTLADGFAVFGYQYKSDWATAKVQAKPGIFDTVPEQVNYANGLYSYDHVQPWTGDKYSFFAYYPYDPNVSTIVPSSKGETLTEGDPYITYTLASRDNPKSLIDVMTASYIDTDVKVSKSVLFTMYHRLAAIDVTAYNYYDYDPDTTNQTDEDIEPITIEIQSLTLNFRNLVNDKVKLFLEKELGAEYTPAAANQSATYTIVSGNNKVDIAHDGEEAEMDFITVTEGNNATSMIVIPQEEKLIVKPTLTYKKKRPDNKGYLTDTEGNEIFTHEEEVTFDTSLIEGRRYYIQFTFTSDAVSIQIITAPEWDNQGRVDFDFE